MDTLQDIAVNSLTILEHNDVSIDDNEQQFALKSMGNAIFKENIKVYKNIHLNKDLRICGDVVPLNKTTLLGTKENQWMESNISCGTFNNIESKIINSNTITSNEITSNYIHVQQIEADYIHEKCKKYELININNVCKNKIDLCIDINPFTILNLTNLKFSTISTDCIVTVKFVDTLHYINKIVIINPNKYNIILQRNNIDFTIEDNNEYQIYEFLYIIELYKWILVYKFK